MQKTSAGRKYLQVLCLTRGLDMNIQELLLHNEKANDPIKSGANVLTDSSPEMEKNG